MNPKTVAKFAETRNTQDVLVVGPACVSRAKRMENATAQKILATGGIAVL